MAAKLDTIIEKISPVEKEHGSDCRYSQFSNNSSRAKAYVKTISGEQQQQPGSTSFSISLDLMSSNEGNYNRNMTEDQTFPSPSSMIPNYSISSIQDRSRLYNRPSTSIISSGASPSIISSMEARRNFEFVQFDDVDTGQKIEFEALLIKEASCARSWMHKGLIVNLGFLLVMVVSVVLGEVYFPLEGVRGRGVSLMNDTKCDENMAACFSVRIMRAAGLFGFLGGVTNWIAIEMLFRRVPYLAGTGIFAKKYKKIREGIKSIVVETLFSPSALKLYFTGRRKSLREIFQLEYHFGSLLDSDATKKLVNDKIDAILARPEGLVLTMMGVNHNHLRCLLRRRVHDFLSDISPIVLDKISSSSLTDGEGLQTEVAKILEEQTEDLTPTKVKQLISVMIRRHLNWLIVWGNVLGALAGVIAEVIAIVVAKYTDT